MRVSEGFKVCVVPPRTLARGLTRVSDSRASRFARHDPIPRRPRCIPGLISAEIGHRTRFCRLTRPSAGHLRWCGMAGRRLALEAAAWGKFRFSPFSYPRSPSAKGRLRSPCWMPIEQDFRVLHHDQGREILLSPWTVPSTNIVDVGSPPGLPIPDPATALAPEVPYGDERQ